MVRYPASRPAASARGISAFAYDHPPSVPPNYAIRRLAGADFCVGLQAVASGFPANPRLPVILRKTTRERRPTRRANDRSPDPRRVYRSAGGRYSPSMFRIPLRLAGASFLLAGFLLSPLARADEPIVIPPPLRVSFVDRATATAQDVIDQAVDLLGIPYRWGGSTPESGFDCSGFVGHVFRTGLGLILPRSAIELSKAGEPVATDELKPGDLVFFNTMRRAFSHVGIYLGDNQFVHAPRAGERVRIDSLRDNYWTRRFNGARRVNPE